jgi:hypothetical protein
MRIKHHYEHNDLPELAIVLVLTVTSVVLAFSRRYYAASQLVKFPESASDKKRM